MRFLLFILLFLTSCVSSQKYSDATRRLDANRVVIQNQTSEIESLKADKKSLYMSNINLSGDTLRLRRQIQLLEDKYDRMEARGSVNTLVAKRRADEIEQTMRRRNSEIMELSSAIEKRQNMLNDIEAFLVDIVGKYFGGDKAVVYQTKSGLNIEFADCRILRDSTVLTTLDNLCDELVPYLQVNNDINVVVDSYAAKNDTLHTTTEVWEFSLKKGALMANRLIERGVDATRVEVVSHGNDYPHRSVFGDDCPLHTTVEFNIDVTRIIELFDEILLKKGGGY
ncbi:MAG: hypothetical protein R3Y50_07300 [Rikenellaceae bacterium]